MKQLYYACYAVFLALSLTLLFACSGGNDGLSSAPNYVGRLTPAAIDNNNAYSLSITALESIEVHEATPDASTLLGGISIGPRTAALHASELASTEQLPAGVIIEGNCGGTVDLSSNNNSGSMIFSAYCVGLGGITMTLNGRVNYTNSPPEMLLEMVDLSITLGGETVVYNATMIVNVTTNTVTLTMQYQGSDGKVYLIVDLSRSGTGLPNDGYIISGRIYHPDHGYVDVSTVDRFGNQIPIVLDCANGHPSSGAISLGGANGSSATIEFTSCSEYILTVNGASTVHIW